MHRLLVVSFDPISLLVTETKIVLSSNMTMAGSFQEPPHSLMVIALLAVAVPASAAFLK
jgi:hypothetical protein